MREQFEPRPLHEETPSGSWRLPLIMAALLGLGVLAGIFWLGRPASEPATPPVPAALPPLSPEEEAYLPQIEIAKLEMSRWENFLGQTVIYLDLNVTNHGNKSVVALELIIEFLDRYGQVVLRETYRPVGAARPAPVSPPAPLAPGETRSFRASFEHIPADWNREPPRVKISGLLLH